MTATPTPRHPSAPEPETGAPPLSSFGQQRLWALDQAEGSHAAYNEQLAYLIEGELDRTSLARALDALTARHETLRTRFVPVEGEARQEIAAPGSGFALRSEDLSGRPDVEELLAARLREECETPFDLGAGPLARGQLLTLAPQRHALLLTLHHSIYDGLSMGIVLTELSTLYAALRRGQPDPLPPLPAQFADHAARQHVWVEGEEARAQSAYWQQQLAGAPALLALPTDRPRPIRQDHDGGRVPVRLSSSLTKALSSAARAQDGTLFTAVLTGWHILLGLLSGESDIVVGIPVAGRLRPEYEGLIGFFANSLALRADLSGDPTGAEAIGRVRGVLREALDHQDLPFERVVHAVNPPRSLSHSPLFQTMFSWGTAPHDRLQLPGARVEPLDIPYAPAKFDLTLLLHREGDGVAGYLDYARALFDHDTAERFGRYLARVLEQLARHPEREITAYSLLDADERAQLLSEGQGRVTSGPVVGPVERLAEQVRVRPDEPALVCGDTRLTYAELDRRANRLAHALHARGVRPGQVVGLHCGRTTEFVVGMWGVLKAGAAYLPLDPGQPHGRLRAIVEEAAPALVLGDVADPPGPWLSVGDVEAEGVREDAPCEPPSPSQLAYVIYTSGSTGRPKGVAATHGNIANLLENWLAVYGALPGEPSSAWASIGFDASVHELFLPLTTGGVLHLVPDELRGDPEVLLGWMREHRIAHAWLPASYISWIDEDPEARLAGLALRQLATGAEPLPERALWRLCAALPGLRVCYVYGPTETTVYSITHNVPRDLDRRSPIGRPVDNTLIYLLDRRRELVPPGVVGEVYIGGAGVTRGYLNRPDLTEERFVDDPFVPGERVYRTGDLARRLPGGDYEFVGRADDQVKLRGFRIEPGEVAAALRELPGVLEAAVLADRDEAGELHLVAGIGRGDAPESTPAQWRAALAERLPDYMIPALFAEFTRLPLNRSGKLDRKEVLDRARASRSDQVNTLAPRDRVEMALYRIWRKVLVHPDIGITDDFFAVGGTSLSAIKVAHLIREEFGRTLPIRDVLQYPTVEQLAARLRGQAPAAPDNGLIEFCAGRDGQRVVCVHPGGGTAFCYLPLASALPDGVRVQGVQAQGIDPGEEPLRSVEAMAEHYLSLLRPGPDETLVLCGLSFGGLVAHEMGRRLARAGHRGVSVVLLDTHGTDDPAERTRLAPVDAAEFRDKLVRFNGMYPGIDDAQIDRYFQIYNLNRAAARNYVPQISDAPLLLVQAAETEVPEGGDPVAAGAALRRFWLARTRAGLTVETVDGGHWDVLEGERIPRIAALIADRLAPPGAAASASPGRADTARTDLTMTTATTTTTATTSSTATTATTED
ncbi:amino acid adenylation domain-containing protein [Streptomyces sp. NPDC005863]|uniref:non-ribosomal peptide synthetase n=1 Tax=unclassified Streptomyces TaxID=2593676 RepID=UPI00340D91DD